MKNIRITKQILPGDKSLVPPTTFAESVELQKTTAILDAWSKSTDQERNLRLIASACIFGLMTAEVIALFALLFLAGFGLIKIDIGLLKLLVPTICVKIIGLAWIVVKYLFSEKLRSQFDDILGNVGSKRPRNG